jgi:Antibiotic biosynthesis monooxygenase.
MILRKWSGRIRSADEAEYVDYVRRTGGAEYAGTDGNLGYQILLRRDADGTSEITTLSWWRDVEAIKRFAGEDYGLAHYYPEDDRFLVERPEAVEHHEVVEDGREA